jgi:hypothetical protein
MKMYLVGNFSLKTRADTFARRTQNPCGGRHPHGQRSQHFGGEQIRPELGYPQSVHRRQLKHDAFNRSFNRLTPATLKAVNDLVVEAAVKLGLEDGRKLRVDTTVVETDIHHPTDNTLLWDVVRVLTRLLGRLAKALELRRIAGFRNRSRAAHRRMYEIQRMTSRQRQGAGSRHIATYRVLIAIAEEVVAGARTALDDTAGMRGQNPLTALRSRPCAMRSRIIAISARARSTRRAAACSMAQHRIQHLARLMGRARALEVIWNNHWLWSQ